MTTRFLIDVGENRKVETFLEEVKVDKLSFYPDNPRVSSLLLNYSGKMDNNSLHKLMWEKQGEATRDLYQAVKKAGVVNEPLIVYKNMTLEGNTRLCVLRELFKDTKEIKWKSVNCRIIKQPLTEKQINYLLCQIHIASKKKDWEPFEQACYFNKMAQDEEKSIKFIKDITGFGEATIRDYIATYRAMKERGARAEEFSLIYETIKLNEVKKVMSKGVDMVSIVRKKFAEGKMADARDPRKLKMILSSEKAKTEFLYGEADINKAEKIAGYTNPEVKDNFLKDVVDFTQAISHISWPKVIEISKDQRKIKIIEDLYNRVNALYSQVKKKAK